MSSPYSEYLKSEHWKKLKGKKWSKAKKKSRVRCAICGTRRGQLDTHHLTYRNLHDVETSDLRILCHPCHFTLHDLLKEGVITRRRGDSAFAQMKKMVLDRRGIQFDAGIDAERTALIGRAMSAAQDAVEEMMGAGYLDYWKDCPDDLELVRLIVRRAIFRAVQMKE
jgi:phage terminase large subunit GpA-like protein